MMILDNPHTPPVKTHHRLRRNGFTHQPDGSVMWRGMWAGHTREYKILNADGTPHQPDAPTAAFKAKLVETYKGIVAELEGTSTAAVRIGPKASADLIRLAEEENRSLSAMATILVAEAVKARDRAM